MKLLDLFCGAGGSAMGFHRAGFNQIVGVDKDPQPNYPFDFIQADALEFMERMNAGGTWEWKGLHIFDGIHAAPPCQGYSDLRHRTGREYPLLIEPTRELLELSGKPWIIENVEGAPLVNPLMLCGTMFPGLRVIRHRLFESNIPLVPLAHGKHPLVFTYDKRKAHYGKLDQDTSFVQVTGGGNCSIWNARDAMGIDWMTKPELNEAIPPAYTQFIGTQVIEQIRRVA